MKKNKFCLLVASCVMAIHLGMGADTNSSVEISPDQHREELLAEFAGSSIEPGQNEATFTRIATFTNSSLVITDLLRKNSRKHTEIHKTITTISVVEKKRFSVVLKGKSVPNSVEIQALDRRPFSSTIFFVNGKPVSTNEPVTISYRAENSHAIELAHIVQELWENLGLLVPYGVLSDVSTTPIESLSSGSAPSHSVDKPAQDYLEFHNPAAGNPVVVRNKHLTRSIRVDFEIRDNGNRVVSVNSKIVGANGTALLGVAVQNWEYRIVAASFL